MTASSSTRATRRQFLAAASSAAAAAWLPGTAIGSAPNWPNKPIRIVAAQAPGSSNDATARALAEFLTAQLKTPVVVENKPGGIGMIAADNVARSAPDGYTLLITLHSQLAQAPVMLKKVPLDPSKDLVPVGAFHIGAAPVVGRKGLPATNFKELMQLAKERPVSVGNFGIGSAWHMQIVELAKKTGAKLDLVHYKGTGPMVFDLMAGNIDIGTGSMAGLTAGLQRGDFKPLWLSVGTSDNPLLPGLRSWADEGVTGPAFQDLEECNMVLAPAGTPPEVVNRLAELIRRSGQESDKVRAVFKTLGVTETPRTGKELQTFIARAWPAYQDLTRQLNLTVE